MIGDFSLDTPISKKVYLIEQRPKPLRISESAPWGGRGKKLPIPNERLLS
jgi:hypothetical protein